MKGLEAGAHFDARLIAQTAQIEVHIQSYREKIPKKNFGKLAMEERLRHRHYMSVAKKILKEMQ